MKYRRFFKILSLILLPVLSMGAFSGAYYLITDPAGEDFGMSMDLLEGTVFKSYLVPGIILLLVNGILPVLVLVCIVRKCRFSYLYLAFQGILLFGWLTVELMINAGFFLPLMHYPCYAIALIFTVSGLLMYRHERMVIRER